jgi:hypothetical protein
MQLIGDLFDQQISLSFTKLSDIFDTSSSILIFHHQVFITVFINMFFIQTDTYKSNVRVKKKRKSDYNDLKSD